MIFRCVFVAYCVGLLVGSLSLIEWMVSRIARLWLAGRLAWLEVWLVRIARRIARESR